MLTCCFYYTIITFDHISVRVAQTEIETFLTASVAESWDGERRVFQCLLCNKVAGTRRDAGRHVESIHLQTDPYTCDLCGNELATRRALQRHISTHHTVK